MTPREQLHPVLRFFVKKKKNADAARPVDSQTTSPQPGEAPPAEKPSLFARFKRKPAQPAPAAADAPSEAAPETPPKKSIFARLKSKRPKVTKEAEVPADLAAVPEHQPADDLDAPDIDAPPVLPEQKSRVAWWSRGKKAQAVDLDIEADVEDEQVQVVDVRAQIDQSLGARFGVQLTILFVLMIAWVAAHLFLVLPAQESGVQAQRDVEQRMSDLEVMQARASGLRQQLLSLRNDGVAAVGSLPDRNGWRQIKLELSRIAARNRVAVDRLQDVPDGTVSPNPESLFGQQVMVRMVNLELTAEYFDYLAFRQELLTQGWPIELRAESIKTISNQREQGIELSLRARYR